MRVGIDAYLLHGGGGYRAAGVSVYTRQLLEALPRVSSEAEYLAFVQRDVGPIPGIRTIVPPIDVSHPSLRAVWEQTGLPVQALAGRASLLHGAVNVLPEAWRGPSTVTVHDLSFLRFPERLSRRRALYLRHAVGRSVRRATRVIAISCNTMHDLVELAGVPEEKVAVVYQGVDPIFRPLQEVSLSPSEERFGGRPYILTVGTLEPRKNHDVLIEAYAALRRRTSFSHVLAIVGARGWMYDDLFRRVESLGLAGDVHFVDYVPPGDLPRWYNCADLFAYPSAYEGFGLPVLEAMACGVPVVTSTSSSLLEVGGDACLSVPVGSVEALESAMDRLLSDPKECHRLRAAGLARAGHFTWDRTARETVAVYRQVLEDA